MNKYCKYCNKLLFGDWCSTDHGEFCNDKHATFSLLFESIAALQEKVDELNRNYNDLIMTVATKCPNETRHQTAKRYIEQAESRCQGPSHGTEKGDRA